MQLRTPGYHSRRKLVNLVKAFDKAFYQGRFCGISNEISVCSVGLNGAGDGHRGGARVRQKWTKLHSPIISRPVVEMSNEIAQLAKDLKSDLKQFPNFPQEGILFEDFLPIFAKPESFRKLVKAFQLHLGDKKVDYIVGLESRGFLFGPALALALNAGFIPVRKPGKLPGPTLSAEFQKEYGSDKFEIQKDVIPKDASVVIVDDILATGGSASAAGELVTAAGAKVVEYLFVMELDFLKGRDKLNAPAFTLLSGQTEKFES